MGKINSFTELKLWKDIVSLRQDWLLLKENFENRPTFYRRVQMLLLNATNNIADGFGRFNYVENVQQLLKARAILCRFMDAVIFLKEEGNIPEEPFGKIMAQAEICFYETDSYIKEELFNKRKLKMT